MLRIKRELVHGWMNEMDCPCPIRLGPKNAKYTELWGEISGPPNCPYAGGKFFLDIAVPADFPYAPPKFNFSTKIWHPNIAIATGEICMNFAESSWDIVMSLRSCLYAVQALMSDPQPDEPTEPVVAKQYKNNYQIFYATAQHWTNVYANGPMANSDCIDKVTLLTKQGINEHQARLALSFNNWQMPTAESNLNTSETKCVL